MNFVLYACFINVLYACCIFCVLFTCCMKLSLPFCFYSFVIMKIFLPVLYVCCMRALKKQKKQKNKKRCVILLCCILCVWNFVLYFNACGTCYGILCYIFPCVERALVFCITFSLVWNAHWYFVLYFSAYGTRSGILCYIFLHVEHTMVFYLNTISRVGTLLDVLRNGDLLSIDQH